MSIEHGEITIVYSDGVSRYGDFGKDKDGYLFCYTNDGWKPILPDKYEAKYWKKKYEELKQSIEEDEIPIYISTKDCKDFVNAVQPLDKREIE